MSKVKSKNIIVFSIFVLSIIIIYMSIIMRINPMSGPSPGQFITMSAQRGNVEVTVLAVGMLEPTKLVSVGAQVSGRLVALNVALGDSVKSGQLVAEIDSLPQINAVRKARAILAGLQAQRDRTRALLKQAQLTYRRQSDILSGRAGTRQDYEAAEAGYESTRADLASLDAQIEGASVDVSIAQSNLDYTKITAPIDGTVVAIVTRQGQTVISAQAAPTIVKLADLRTMSVKARISEADVGRLRPGTPVVLRAAAHPKRLYRTTLRSIDPAPDQILIDTAGPAQASGSGQAGDSAVYFNARFEVDNADGALRPLMTAQVTFILDHAEQAVLVPTAALRSTGEGQGQITVLGQDGQQQNRTVRTGLSTATEVQITEGIEAGEAVVVAGPQDVAPTIRGVIP